MSTKTPLDLRGLLDLMIRRHYRSARTLLDPVLGTSDKVSLRRMDGSSTRGKISAKVGKSEQTRGV